MPECSFCKNNYEVPKGMTFVLPSGEVLYFCSSKCQKNNKLGRVGKKTTWVKKPKKSKEVVEKKIKEKPEVKKEEPKKQSFEKRLDKNKEKEETKKEVKEEKK